jgi:hypothetical protein
MRISSLASLGELKMGMDWVRLATRETGQHGKAYATEESFGILTIRFSDEHTLSRSVHPTKLGFYALPNPRMLGSAIDAFGCIDNVFSH